MAEITDSSTVPRRQLGRHLRQLRHACGMSSAAAGQVADVVESTMTRWELGIASPRAPIVRLLCQTYGATGELTEELVRLAAKTKEKGWWQPYRDVIHPGFDLYLGLESAAAGLTVYENELVNGLLQTETYASAVIRAGLPTATDAEISRRVAMRMNRKMLLTRTSSPLTLAVLLSEPALRWPAGGAAAMAAQLRHVVTMTGLPNVSVRVLPYRVGAHVGMTTGAFTILDFPARPAGGEPPTVYAETHAGALYLDRPDEAQSAREAWDTLAGKALSEADSIDLINTVAKEMS